MSIEDVVYLLSHPSAPVTGRKKFGVWMVTMRPDAEGGGAGGESHSLLARRDASGRELLVPLAAACSDPVAARAGVTVERAREGAGGSLRILVVGGAEYVLSCDFDALLNTLLPSRSLAEIAEQLGLRGAEDVVRAWSAAGLGDMPVPAGPSHESRLDGVPAARAVSVIAPLLVPVAAADGGVAELVEIPADAWGEFLHAVSQRGIPLFNVRVTAGEEARHPSAHWAMLRSSRAAVDALFKEE
jgi:hypothetical protein